MKDLEKLEEVRNHYCIKEYGHHYDNALYRGLVTDYDQTQITLLHAKEQVKAKLQEAVEKATLLINGVPATCSNIKVNPESILSLIKE